MEVGLSPGDFVIDGDRPAALPKKGAEPPHQFSVHVHCGQTAGWIKMALGVEVGLGSDHIALDGEPAPILQKGGGAVLANFRSISIVAKWLDASRCHVAWRWALVQATLCWMGTQLPFPEIGSDPPQFSAHVYCGQTAG